MDNYTHPQTGNRYTRNPDESDEQFQARIRQDINDSDTTAKQAAAEQTGAPQVISAAEAGLAEHLNNPPVIPGVYPDAHPGTDLNPPGVMTKLPDGSPDPVYAAHKEATKAADKAHSGKTPLAVCSMVVPTDHFPVDALQMEGFLRSGYISEGGRRMQDIVGYPMSAEPVKLEDGTQGVHIRFNLINTARGHAFFSVLSSGLTGHGVDLEGTVQRNDDGTRVGVITAATIGNQGAVDSGMVELKIDSVP